MNNKRIAYSVVLAFGLFILALGIINIQPPREDPSALTDAHWRRKAVQRYCNNQPQTMEFRGYHKANTLYEWQNSDCKGYDGVVYYAYDALILGLVITGGSAAALWVSRKQTDKKP